MQDFLPIMNEHCEHLSEKLYALSISKPSRKFKKLDKYLYNELNDEEDNQLNDDKIYDIVPIVTLCTLDIICETAFGCSEFF